MNSCYYSTIILLKYFIFASNKNLIMNNELINIFWFRRDLRFDDNSALYHALKSEQKLLCIFIFDSQILDILTDRSDTRLNFIYQEIKNLKKILENAKSNLIVLKGKPTDIFKQLIEKYKVANVFANRDYEPYAVKRDFEIKKFLNSQNIEFHLFKDHVIFEADEIRKNDNSPYTVFGFYKKAWLNKFYQSKILTYNSENYFHKFLNINPSTLPDLNYFGFNQSSISYPSREINLNVIKNYDETRNFPQFPTSGLGLHLRFGTLSIRKIIKISQQYNESWMNELIWREFFIQILSAFPYVEKSAFKPIYNNIEWLNNQSDFERWCKGNTGYAMVDAGMRELNSTGFMHNRVRMLTASFLCKHLLIDWRWGEAYFASKLLDFELSSNNGNWQWAAGCGCDAAPYFRIFNPDLQTNKFDPQLIYIRKWVKEFDELNYVKMIDHKFARERCLAVYKRIF